MQNPKIVTLAIAFLFAVNSYAKKDLEHYYLMSQKATVEVCKGNYDKANELFKASFKDYKIAYFTDLNNALYAAVRAKTIDSTYIEKLFAEIKTKGISIRDRYAHRPAYIPFTNLMVGSNSDSLPPGDLMAFNLVNDALIRDQSIRSISGKLSHPAFYTQDKTILPAVRAIDSVNYTVISTLLRSAIEKKENLESTIGYPAVQHLLTILHHCSPWGYYDKTLLDSCVALGVLYSPSVACVFDQYCISNYLNTQSDWAKEQSCHKVYGLYGGSVATQFTKSCYIFKIEESLLKIINNRRKQLYLNDVYESAKIISYAFFFGSEGFVYPGIEVIPDQDLENSYEQRLKEKRIGYILYSSKEDYDYHRKW